MGLSWGSGNRGFRMQDSRLGFAMGHFFCRFLDPRIEQCPPEGCCLVEPCWDAEADDPPLRYQNLADQLAQQLKLDLNATPLASWLLARVVASLGGEHSARIKSY